MQRIGTGVKSIIENQRKALVLVEPNGDLDLPGGRLEPGESSINCLIREIQEETGVSVEVLKPIASWSFSKGAQLLITGKTFICKYLGGRIILSPEHAGYFWVKFEDVNKLNFKHSYGVNSIVPITN